MDLSLQSSVLMYCTNMETATSLHKTYYTPFKYLRCIEIHMKGFQKVRTLIARIQTLADIFAGISKRTLIAEWTSFADISVAGGGGKKILNIEMSD